MERINQWTVLLVRAHHRTTIWRRFWHRFARVWTGRNAVGTAMPPLDRHDAQHCLLATQRFLTEVFDGCGPRMSPRDLQLYRQLVRTTSLQTLVALRVANFELMCRLLGEGVARTHQRRIDAWLPVRR